jgi:CxxC motif-containing protein
MIKSMPILTCIVCPLGCALTVEDGPPPSGAEAAGADRPLVVTGNRCPRGAVYAREEILAPKRVVTATCALDWAAMAARGTELGQFPVSRRVPVKSSPCPKAKIPALLKDIYQLRISLPVKPGDVVIADWQGLGIDVVTVRALGTELREGPAGTELREGGAGTELNGNKWGQS